MAKRTVSVALVQLAAHDRDQFSQAWPNVLEQIVAAASADVNVIVLPEVTIPGYVIGNTPLDGGIIERAIADLQAIADHHGCVVVAGVALPDDCGPNGLRNCAVVICPNAPPQSTSKRFLWHFDNRWFDAGDDLTPIATPYGRLGIVICADGRIPTIVSTLVDRGAELLVIVTAWVTSGRDPQTLENIQADLLARVRAWENAVPLVVANKVGCELASVLYCGKSQAIDANGVVLALASQDCAETLLVDVDLDAAHAPQRAANQLKLAPSPGHSRTERIAVAIGLTPQQHEVADWSSVTAVLCMQSSASSVHAPPIAILEQIRTASVVTVGSLHLVVLPDDALSDPGYLPSARRAGYDIFVWYPQHIAAPWVMPLARTRAVELRAYVIVIEKSERISIIDPLGVVIAGTTATLLLPQFVYDPTITAATTLAPGTDIMAGLVKVEAIVEQSTFASFDKYGNIP